MDNSNIKHSGTQVRRRPVKMPPASPGKSISSKSSTQSTSSLKALTSVSYNRVEQLSDTACKQVTQLELKPIKTKSDKLLSTKSLSQLMPKKFLFSKRNSNDESKSKAKIDNLDMYTNTDIIPSATIKSFPNGPIECNELQLESEFDAMNLSTEFDSTSNNKDISEQPDICINRVDSASLIGFPRQSTSNSLGYHTDENRTLTPSNLSPIVGSQNEIMRNVVASTPTLRMRPLKVTNHNENHHGPKQSEGVQEEKSKPKTSRYKPFKNTALVLRDVKNSIGLRMKAKHDSRAFEKLTNETMTSPIKLYSPFNIYTPSCGRESKVKENKSKSKSRRKLNLGKNKSKNEKKNGSGSRSMNDQVDEAPKRSPKGRIALRHKKHMMQANQFTFDSPTGRLRETVKDVERFQQCIEDISKAIRARSSLT